MDLVAFLLFLTKSHPSTFWSWLCDLRSSSYPKQPFFYPLRFQKTRAYLILNAIYRAFGNADSYNEYNGMPTSPQTFYFQVLGNSQKLERVFFKSAEARIRGKRLKFFFILEVARHEYKTRIWTHKIHSHEQKT